MSTDIKTTTPSSSSTNVVNNEKSSEVEVAKDAGAPPSSEAPAGAAGGAAGGDDIEYPSTSKQITTMLSIGLVVFLVALDRTILATATPTITNEFNSIQDVGWYASAYMLTMSAFMLLFGRIYTFYNPKVVFMCCISLFEIGSAVSGAAPSSITFIIGRAISGAGASAIMAGAMVIIFQTVPLQRRPMFQGTMAALFGISSVAGPLIGGAFTTRVTWRWCFYINLPIGGAVLVYLFFFLHVTPARDEALPMREKLVKLDPLGTAVLIPCVVCVLLALEWGGTTYAWSSWRIILLLVLFGVLLIVFLGIQIWKGENATVPPRVAKQRTIAFAATGQLFVGGTMVVLTYFIPIWFQAIQHVDAVDSGLRNLGLMLAMVVGAVSTGICVSRLGYYTPFMICGFAIMTVGCGLMTLWTPTVTKAHWIGFQVVVGLGLGLGMQQANTAAQTVLSRRDIATGASLMFFSQSFGGSIWVSVAQSVFTNKLATGLATIPGLNAQLVTSVGATDLYNVVPSAMLDEVLVVYNDAIAKGAFYVPVALSAVAFLSATGVEWKSVKKNKQRPAPGESKPETKKGDSIV